MRREGEGEREGGRGGGREREGERERERERERDESYLHYDDKYTQLSWKMPSTASKLIK